ncbi:amino acid ABC transporter, permease protein [Azorhizobium caulinodans ORS 571]|uniref:Amino acid ABC transporter, permease protein n=1 Tax=Azorhizobium caulinodans (strain ATCC 43989 / DSM 5975 / JCM 20966 / LMG 6465 / NBRC 14845 / NCIMB 13405 / ORS 571) TaxID=438753 RepID=A8HW93_AZOC5|nr:MULTISPECIES: amino acid ABC transporter permease [Azorhizobium]TDT89577.1 amino acid ABC transporter membrane protein 1 (PAAT family) [Azorhizobium sp. AG788]BAF90403.1 amino acid ABC transporter, permease protein [Azorhizobium caulinodans ORS 571]
MNYVFQFGDVFNAWPELLMGALLTIRLSAMAMAIGLVVAVVCALGKTGGPRPVRWLVDTYVEVIRNTPFLVQIFLIFFGLPRMGIRLDANEAALLAMVVNIGAYATEIVRAGIETIHKGQIEAGLALGLKPVQVFTYIVIFPALKAIYPALTSQFILLMLTSSVVSAISAEELTAIANNLQAQTFRSFEIYIVVTAMYLAMSLMFAAVFELIYRAVFARSDATR